MKAFLKKWFLDRRVTLVVLIVGIACECYLATLGTWWMRPVALFLALTMTHVVTIQMWTWREIDRQRQANAFFSQFVKPAMEQMERAMAQEADSDDDEAHKPTNVN